MKYNNFKKTLENLVIDCNKFGKFFKNITRKM